MIRSCAILRWHAAKERSDLIRPLIRPISILFCLCLGFAASCGAATYYVSPAGFDTNNGSSITPFRQIRKGIAVAVPGDSILVADGSYLGFDIKNFAGTAALPLNIKAQGSNAVVTVTADRADNRDTMFISFSSYVIIDGLRSFSANRAAVRIDSSPHITIRNGVFGNNTTWGVFTDFSDDTVLESLECYGSVQQHGIYTSNSGDRPIVRGCYLHDNHDAGLHMNGDVTQGGDGIISGALVENNLIVNNGLGGGAAINMDGVQDSTIRNNLLYNNHASGITAFQFNGAQGPKGLQIYHNTVDNASDARWVLLINNSAGPCTVRNNIFINRNSAKGCIDYLTGTDIANFDSDYNVLDKVTPNDGGTTYTLAQWQALGHESHSVTASVGALFVDTASGNYHLAVGSPAIDAGATLGAVTGDREGNSRPSGLASDMGCFERSIVQQPRVMWTNLNGALSLWTVIAPGNYATDNYGPYANWQPAAFAVGTTDGLTRVLWNNSDGRAAVWTISSPGLPINDVYGPFAGWQAISIAVGTDNKPRVLWKNLNNGAASLWTINAPGSFTADNHGPYSGWAPVAVAMGPDNLPRLLWNHADGRMNLWKIPSPGNQVGDIYGPFAGWQAVSLTVGGDNKARVLWVSANTSSLWTINGPGSYTTDNRGPFGGWTAGTVAVGYDNKARVGWNSAAGEFSLWTIDTAGAYTAQNYGPFNGWTAAAVTIPNK